MVGEGHVHVVFVCVGWGKREVLSKAVEKGAEEMVAGEESIDYSGTGRHVVLVAQKFLFPTPFRA